MQWTINPKLIWFSVPLDVPDEDAIDWYLMQMADELEESTRVDNEV